MKAGIELVFDGHSFRYEGADKVTLDSTNFMASVWADQKIVGGATLSRLLYWRHYSEDDTKAAPFAGIQGGSVHRD